MNKEESSVTEYYNIRCEFLIDGIFETCGECYRYNSCYEAMQKEKNKSE